MHHQPVLLKKAVDFLVTNPSGVYFDATLGFGGHTELILANLNSDAKVIATDKDQIAFDFCSKKFENDKRLELYKASFTEIETICRIEFIEKFDGILADLGVSSFQLDDADSGFTYRENVVLDLRMNKSTGKPAYELLNELSEFEIADIIYKYGEEKKSRQIARKICERRKVNPIKTTGDLTEIVAQLMPEPFLRKSLSRVFQAIRIYVNNELDELENFLNKCIKRIKPGGRIVVISYHSLEDRIVKNVFKYGVSDCECPPSFPVCVCDKRATLKFVIRKPVVPDFDEIKLNNRARSAKMRIVEGI